MVEVSVHHIIISDGAFVMLLKGVDDRRMLPIVIGAPEAQAIALALSAIEAPRPMTHDLMRNLLQNLNITLTRVEVVALKMGTFYSELVLSTPDGEFRADCRPSDAVALALRTGSSIYVDEGVMNEAGCAVSEELMGPASADPNRKSESPRDPVDALRRKLQKAIEQERYEDAATLRDQIARMDKQHKTN